MWVQPDTRDSVIDLVCRLYRRTELPQSQLIGWLGISHSKYYDWRSRYGKVNEHNGLVPRDWWLEDWEKEAIIDYFIDHPTDGYRRLTYMMIDEEVVAVSASTVYRVLSRANLLGKRQVKPSLKIPRCISQSDQ